jgi:hypothetical protein
MPSQPGEHELCCKGGAAPKGRESNEQIARRRRLATRRHGSSRRTAHLLCDTMYVLEALGRTTGTGYGKIVGRILREGSSRWQPADWCEQSEPLFHLKHNPAHVSKRKACMWHPINVRFQCLPGPLLGSVCVLRTSPAPAPLYILTGPLLRSLVSQTTAQNWVEECPVVQSLKKARSSSGTV